MADIQLSTKKMLDDHANDMNLHGGGGGGNVNPNILVNADWRGMRTEHRHSAVINQGGQATYSEGGETIDRWILANHGNSKGQVSINEGFLRLEVLMPGDRPTLFPNIPFMFALINKTVTLSIMYKTSSPNVELFLQSAFDIFYEALPQASSFSIASMTGTAGEIPFNAVGISFLPNATAGEYIDIAGFKLELGDKSTLIDEPPQDYGAELAKCQTPTLHQWCGDAGGSGDVYTLDTVRVYNAKLVDGCQFSFWASRASGAPEIAVDLHGPVPLLKGDGATPQGIGGPGVYTVVYRNGAFFLSSGGDSDGRTVQVQATLKSQVSGPYLLEFPLANQSDIAKIQSITYSDSSYGRMIAVVRDNISPSTPFNAPNLVGGALQPYLSNIIYSAANKVGTAVLGNSPIGVPPPGTYTVAVAIGP